MSGKILVVDDSLTVRMNLMDMLDAADLPAEACATLAEARGMRSPRTASRSSFWTFCCPTATVSNCSRRSVRRLRQAVRP